MKKKDKKLYGISVPLDVFEDHINVIWGDGELASKYANFDNKHPTPELVDGWTTQRDGTGQIYCYLGKDLKSKNRIVHELTHAVLTVTHKRNLFCTDQPGEQELEAYLMGYVIGNILDTKPKQWHIWKGTKAYESKWKKQK